MEFFAWQVLAARFVNRDYRRSTSASGLVSHLGWDQLHTRRLLAQSTMLYRIHHHLVNICLPHFITQAPYISRRDYNLKKTLCSWSNNRLIQVLLLSSDNSHLESATSHCSYCPNSRCFPGGRPSCHQRVRTSCRFQDAVNFKSMVFTHTSLVLL